MRIKIYTDESVPVAIATGLKRRNVDATSAHEVGNLGLSDQEQLEYATQHGAILFTHDTDFLWLGDQWVQHNKSHWGITYVHQDKLGMGECIRRLKESADVFSTEEFKNYLVYL